MDDSQHLSPARRRQRASQKRRNRKPMAAQKAKRGEPQTVPSEWMTVLGSSVEYLRRNPTTTKIIAAPIIALSFLFILNLLFGGRVPPNVFIFDQPSGSLLYHEAANQLDDVWLQDTVIRLVADDREWQASPSELGIELDALASAKSTNGIGLAGIPFGYWVDPLINVNSSIMQQYLEKLAEDVYIAPTNARYEWVDGTVRSVPGQDGVQLDVETTLSYIRQQPLNAVRGGVQLLTQAIPSSSQNADTFLSTVQEMVLAPFELVAYDPFSDKYVRFTPSPQVISSWVEAGETSLIVRENLVTDYVTTLNETPASGLPAGAYLKPEEVIDAINQALVAGSMQAQATIRFYPTTYEVLAGDSGYKISRKTGIPFFLIEEANPDVDLSVLSPGDVINLPSRDVTIPLPVVANKRIVVDLHSQSLVAYEDGQVVFSWQISSGIEEAPTSPGIYQILSHEEVAYGSSYTLCGEAGCGQWELNWFMGIYEVTPGLVNGFHGAVLLPNGSYLGGNNVGVPYTLGCIMSRDDQARQLYDWAELGTIVEIISDEFAPQSELASRAFGV